VSVTSSGLTVCTQTVSGSAIVTVNALPTATIAGSVSTCLNSSSPAITFTGANGTAPYTFTYSINNVVQPTIATTTGNSISINAPTGVTGSFVYSLVSVQSSGTPACSQNQSGTATVTVNPLPTATIAGTVAVCQNAPSPAITFTGADGTAPYTFSYAINGVVQPNITTTTGNSISVNAPTGVTGSFVYSLVSVQSSGTPACSQNQLGTATVTINPLPLANPVITDYVLCDDNNPPGVGQEIFTLNTKSAEIANGQANVTVSYYDSQPNATSQISPLPNSHINTPNPQQIWINIRNNTTG
jgi:hypothetical protein